MTERAYFGSSWDTLIHAPGYEAKAEEIAAKDGLTPSCRKSCPPGWFYKVDSRTFNEHEFDECEVK